MVYNNKLERIIDRHLTAHVANCVIWSDHFNSYLQRLHRIITSEQLVSPHHSAREMIEVMKNRDFAKLFQKSVRKV